MQCKNSETCCTQHRYVLHVATFLPNTEVLVQDDGGSRTELLLERVGVGTRRRRPPQDDLLFPEPEAPHHVDLMLCA
jgi:hypothetical protein